MIKTASFKDTYFGQKSMEAWITRMEANGYKVKVVNTTLINRGRTFFGTVLKEPIHHVIMESVPQEKTLINNQVSTAASINFTGVIDALNSPTTWVVTCVVFGLVLSTVQILLGIPFFVGAVLVHKKMRRWALAYYRDVTTLYQLRKQGVIVSNNGKYNKYAFYTYQLLQNTGGRIGMLVFVVLLVGIIGIVSYQQAHTVVFLSVHNSVPVRPVK